MSGFFITGTDTDVGKTIITGLLTAALNEKGIRTIPYKPVQSGAIYREKQLIAPDVDMYEKINNENWPHSATYLLKAPVSPHLAAIWDQVIIEKKQICEDYRKLNKENQCVLVEGAGGVAVPLIDEFYCVSHLMQELQLPVIIVAKAGLGTINHTTLTVQYIQQLELPITGIIMNGFQDSEKLAQQENVKMIEKMTDIPVIGKLPFVEDLEHRLNDKTFILRLIEQINIDYLIEKWKEHFCERINKMD
ncbi:dethiobiotin synthase [Alkalihalobacterium alkalinitrilicum]|uniref:dethiobiotin synthase n=1 Tax=Alkalihalobacterium alkalinitrilicum TaxID=427920 RepID=UPI0009955FC0|nr:dethiobiotin synthase [Alkalihalobacterium alkalinitrilicum]